jgi:hypothetical protein
LNPNVNHLVDIGSNVYFQDSLLAFNNINIVDFTRNRTIIVGQVDFSLVGGGVSETIFIRDNTGQGITLLNGGVHIGKQVFNSKQNVIDIGYNAAAVYQDPGCIAIGSYSGRSQNTYAIAIGSYSGRSQNTYAIAVGQSAGYTQNTTAIAIGQNAGHSQSTDAIAIGTGAGYAQNTAAIAIGTGTGQGTQGASSVAIGSYAGSNSQRDFSVAIGNYAGKNTQNTYSVAIGNYTGNDIQGASSVAIGDSAGRTFQGTKSVAIGVLAGGDSQGASSVAIGDHAGQTSQGVSAIAIGTSSGVSQNNYSIAIGQDSGRTQNSNAIAIGTGAGYSQNQGAIAIGNRAGSIQQGANSIAIGSNVSTSNTGSIVLNATGNTFASQLDNSFYVNPIRVDDTSPSFALGYTYLHEIVQPKILVFPGQVWTSGGAVPLPVVTGISSNVVPSGSLVTDAGGRFEMTVGPGTSLDIISPGVYGLANVIFGNSFATAPVVILTPTNVYASQLSPFVQVYPGYFQVCTALSSAPVSILKMNYTVLGILS